MWLDDAFISYQRHCARRKWDGSLQIQAKQGELRQIKAVQTNINEAISERQAMADEECSKAQELEQKIVVSSENLAGILPDGQLPNLASNEQVSQMTDADAKEIELRYFCSTCIWVLQSVSGAPSCGIY